MQTCEPRTVEACQLQYLRVLCTCAISLSLFGAVFFLWWLRGVLVPLTFAVFLAFLCEPVLRVTVLAPAAVAGLLCEACRRRACWPPAAEAAEARAAEGGRAARRACGCRPLAWLQRLWEFLAVVFCCLAIFGPLCGVVYGVVALLSNFDWHEYETSPKWHDLEELLHKAGIIKSDQSFNPAALWNIFRTELMSAAFSVISVTENLLLTILIYIFCLLAMLPGIHDRARHSEDVQGLVQQYLIRKTVASLLIAILVMVALKVMHVPLILLCGVLTFLLNFIPNLGSFIAILFPVPLVWLKPESTLIHVVLVVVVQFLVHNIAGQLIEPWMISRGLDLHPLTVIVALTFWGSIWGIPGTVLSVPVTCVLRLWVGRHEHPLARHIHGMFDDPLGPMPAQGSLSRRRSSSSDVGSGPLLTKDGTASAAAAAVRERCTPGCDRVPQTLWNQDLRTSFPQLLG